MARLGVSLRMFGRRLRLMGRRGRLDDELRDEVRLHMDLRRQALIDRGMAPHDAEIEARRMFGNVDVDSRGDSGHVGISVTRHARAGYSVRRPAAPTITDRDHRLDPVARHRHRRQRGRVQPRGRHAAAVAPGSRAGTASGVSVAVGTDVLRTPVAEWILLGRRHRRGKHVVPARRASTGTDARAGRRRRCSVLPTSIKSICRSTASSNSVKRRAVSGNYFDVLGIVAGAGAVAG